MNLISKKGDFMKKIGKSKFFSIILILVTSAMVFIKVIAQIPPAASKHSQNTVLDTDPILEAKLDKSEFQLGSPIELTLTIKNKTSSTVVLFDVEPERGFDITIEDMKGISFPLTEEGRKRKYPTNIVRRETVFLEPDKELKLSNIRLDKLFNLKRKGNYILEVRRTYYLQGTSDKNADLESKDKILIGTVKFSIK